MNCFRIHRLIPALLAWLVLLRSGAAEQPYLYPMDFAPHEESAEDIQAREAMFEKTWSDYFAKLDAMTNGGDRKAFDAFVKATPGRTLLLLASDYGYEAFRQPALEKLTNDFLRNLTAAEKVLAKSGGIKDIGDVANLNTALEAAFLLKKNNAFTPGQSAMLEPLLAKYVDGKAVFWGFTRKFPYYLSGYNKESTTLNVAAYTKGLYAGTGKFQNTIDSFDAVWRQMTTQAYETDNSPHYDASVNLGTIFGWVVDFGLEEELRRAPDMRMILDRLAKTVMPNGESANYGKSMWSMRKIRVDGVEVDDYRVNGSMGLGTCLRWAYRLYGDPHYLYLARKYEAMNASGRAPLTLMPKAFDLNFFSVKGAEWGADAPLCATTIRLKGPGYALDRGVRREDVQPVQDKLMLSTGSHPRSPFMMMDLSFTQSKVKAMRRMGVDNHIFNGTHTVTVVGRPDDAQETNRIFIAPDDIPYPGTGEAAKAVSTCADPQGYELRDYSGTRVNADLAYGEVEYSRLQFEGVHARRKMALLNNGVMVVEDLVWADEKYKGGKNAGAIYNVWSSIIAKGANWVVNSPKRGHFPDGTDGGLTCTLLCIAPAPGLKIGQNSDIDFFAHAPLTRDKPVRIVSAILPLRHDDALTHARAVGEGIRTATDAAGNTTVRIPYSASQTLRVVLFAGGTMPAWYAIENTAGPVSLGSFSYNLKHPVNVSFAAAGEVVELRSGGKALSSGSDYSVTPGANAGDAATVRLLPACLNRLPPGAHAVEVLLKDNPPATFRVSVGDTRMNARLLPPYSVAFNDSSEFYVPGCKVEVERNENTIAALICGGKTLVRDSDYTQCGGILRFTPAFEKTLTDAHARTDLTIRTSSGADLALRLNADTRPGITLSNSRRSRSYTGDQMVLPWGYRDNQKVKATGGDFTVQFYPDWLFRGKPVEMHVKDGQTLKLPSTSFKSFRVWKKPAAKGS